MDYPGNIERSTTNKVKNSEKINKQFKILVENIITPICVVQQGKYVFVNPPFEKISGYSAEELYALKSAWEIVEPEYKQLVKEMTLTAKTGQEQCSKQEIKIINKNGEVRWIDFNEAVIEYEGKTAILGFCIDITARRSDEEAKRDLEFIYRTIFETSGTSIMVLEEDMLISLANGELEKLLGYSKEEIENKMKWTTFVADDDLPRMKEFHRKRRIDDTSVPAQYEFKLVTRWGDIKDINITVAVIPGTKKTVASFVDITERKLAEEALQRSEEKYRELIDNSHDIIYTLNTEGVFTFVSSGWTMLLGHPVNEVIGKPFQPFVHPDDITSCKSFLKKTIQTGQRQSGVEYRVQHVDGSWRWHTSNGMPLRDESAKTTGFEGIASDITERKQTEAALRQSEEMLRNSESKYRSLAEDMEAMVCTFLPDGTLTYVNRVCCEYFQRNRDELIGNIFLDMLPNEAIRQEVFKNYSSLTISQPIHTHEQLVIAPDGTKLWQRWTNRAIFNNDSELIYYQSIGIDITERKNAEEELQAAYEQMEAFLEELIATEEELRNQYRQLQQQEQALHDSEQRLADIINFLPDPTFVINNEGQVTVWNQAAEEMTGIKTKNIIGKGNYEYALPFYNVRRPILIDQVLFPDKETEKRYYALYRDKETITAETNLPVIHGEPRFFLAKAGPLYDTHGNLAGAIESMRDITDRKLMEDELKKSQQQMEQVIENLPDATSVIDHEGKVVFWNKAMEAMTGVSKEEIIGRGNYEYAIPFYGERRPVLVDLALMSNREYDQIKGKYEFIRQDGAIITGETYVPCTYHGKGAYLWGAASKLIDVDGNIVGAIQAVRDITERKELEKARAEEAAIQKMTLLSIGDGVISTDDQGKIKLFNKVAEQLTGWLQEEAFGKPLEEVFNIYNEFTRERCLSPSKEVLGTGKTVEIANHTILVSKDGTDRPIEDSAAPIKDEDGKINGVVLVFRDFSEKKERQEKINYLSYHDYLTGLYNRRFFEEELKRLDTERNLPITLVMADVNGLKLTNDAFGHVMGDRLLSKVAEIMKNECRTDDIIARIGGDEFMFLLPNTDAEEAKIIVKRINGTLAQQKIDSIVPSVSFGWATKHVATEVMNNVSKQAEDNMYRRKLSESSSMRNRTIKVIISTLYEKNKREEQHSQRVSELCSAIGHALDISAENIGELRAGGLMHDIGKIALDEAILNKPGTLNDAEWFELKRHSETGYRILMSVNEFSQIAEYVLAHHERWDGKGYPKGLKGEEIPLQARIMALADAYDAMTCDRPYRKALSDDMVIAEIERNAGKQFDPIIAGVFLEKVLRESTA
ncbi:MAG: PAS domain S-box protein [Syntrophomonadaceae bacterium]|nr:PAS domain S-box protein [Syntrophomonadaceae bacterium]